MGKRGVVSNVADSNAKTMKFCEVGIVVDALKNESFILKGHHSRRATLVAGAGIALSDLKENRHPIQVDMVDGIEDAFAEMKENLLEKINDLQTSFNDAVATKLDHEEEQVLMEADLEWKQEELAKSKVDLEANSSLITQGEQDLIAAVEWETQTQEEVERLDARNAQFEEDRALFERWEQSSEKPSKAEALEISAALERQNLQACVLASVSSIFGVERTDFDLMIFQHISESLQIVESDLKTLIWNAAILAEKARDQVLEEELNLQALREIVVESKSIETMRKAAVKNAKIALKDGKAMISSDTQVEEERHSCLKLAQDTLKALDSASETFKDLRDRTEVAVEQEEEPMQVESIEIEKTSLKRKLLGAYSGFRAVFRRSEAKTDNVEAIPEEVEAEAEVETVVEKEVETVVEKVETVVEKEVEMVVEEEVKAQVETVVEPVLETEMNVEAEVGETFQRADSMDDIPLGDLIMRQDSEEEKPKRKSIAPRKSVATPRGKTAGTPRTGKTPRTGNAKRKSIV